MDDDMGIVICKMKLAWTDGGWGRRLPFRVRRTIVRLWNYVACRLTGHDWYPDSLLGDGDNGKRVCVDCLKSEAHHA